MSKRKMCSKPGQNRPNILFLVWDACRYDYAEEEAPTLRELAEDNLWFENAIAPSTWSLPSHASMFTGQHPHEHGLYNANDSMDSVTLFERLQQDNYNLYGVSGNGFVSHSTNVHQWFDEFYYTAGQGPYLDGLTVYEHVFGQRERGEHLDTIQATTDTIKAVITHDHSIKSLVNFSAVGLNRVAANIPPLQRIPHPVCNPYQPYSYKPSRNSNKICEFLSRQTDEDDPFFIFANYMDAHRPYHPPKRYQRKHLGEALSYGELSRLNQEVEDPWQFLSKHHTNDIDEADIETIRKLYRGEVNSVDDHLALLLEELERQDLRENTLIVVTSDHGENLGEVDERGQRRMGHECSVSDHLLRVPMVIAHPEIKGRRIEKYINTKNLYDLLVSQWESVLESGGTELGRFTEEQIVVSEYPAMGGDEIYQRYESIPKEVLKQRVETDYVVLYTNKWRLIMDSENRRWALKNGKCVDFEEAPEDFIIDINKYLNNIKHSNESTRISDSDVEQLEALGYL